MKNKHIGIEYNKDGGYAEEKELVCAKYTEKHVNKEILKFYFVLVNKYGKLYNPLEESMTGTLRRLGDINLKKTNKEAFDFYTNFLRTKIKRNLTIANRKYSLGC